MHASTQRGRYRETGERTRHRTRKPIVIVRGCHASLILPPFPSPLVYSKITNFMQFSRERTEIFGGGSKLREAPPRARVSRRDFANDLFFFSALHPTLRAIREIRDIARFTVSFRAQASTPSGKYTRELHPALIPRYCGIVNIVRTVITTAESMKVNVRI